MKLLVIEDSAVIIAALRRGLRTSFIVDVAKTGVEGLHAAEVSDYDAIVLDLGLPDMAGIDVCRRLCLGAGGSPVLVLTAVADIQTKVNLLDAGADDYMTKPFRLEELRARLRVLVRLDRRPAGPSVLVAGGLRLDMASRQVERDGRTIELRRKEFDLLEYFLHNRDRVVTRPMITDHVWDVSDHLWTNAVDVHVKYLRDKIDRPFPLHQPLIKTIHGVGYRLETPRMAAVHKEMHKEAAPR